MFHSADVDQAQPESTFLPYHEHSSPTSFPINRVGAETSSLRSVGSVSPLWLPHARVFGISGSGHDIEEENEDHRVVLRSLQDAVADT